MKVRVQFTVEVDPEAIMNYAAVDRSEVRNWVKSWCRGEACEGLTDIHYEYQQELERRESMEEEKPCT